MTFYTMKKTSFHLILSGLVVLLGIAIIDGSVYAEATNPEFRPQTSSTWTDVPSPAVLPATGPERVLAVFAGTTSVGYVGHLLVKRTRA